MADSLERRWHISKERGTASESRVFHWLKQQPLVAEVRPTPEGDFYDFDVFLMPLTDLPGAVRVEVKSSQEGIERIYYEKIKQRFSVSQAQITLFLLDNYLILLNAGQTTEGELFKSFYGQLDQLTTYYRDYKGPFLLRIPESYWLSRLAKAKGRKIRGFQPPKH